MSNIEKAENLTVISSESSVATSYVLVLASSEGAILGQKPNNHNGKIINHTQVYNQDYAQLSGNSKNLSFPQNAVK